MNNNGQVNTTRKNIKNDDMFEGTISSEKIIDTLNSTLTSFSLSTSLEEQRKVIDSFYEAVEKWQIILLNPQTSHKIWLQVPISYYETVTKFRLIDRIKVFMRSGVFIDSEITGKYADIISNVKFPMEVTVERQKEFSHNPNTSHITREEIFNFSIIQVTESIIHLMKNSPHRKIAIYKRPYGVVAMNKTSYHLTNLEKETNIDAQSLKNSIEVVDFSKLIESTEILFK